MRLRRGLGRELTKSECDAIRYVMLDLSLTQRRLAKTMKKPLATVNSYLRGASPLPIRLAEPLYEVLQQHEKVAFLHDYRPSKLEELEPWRYLFNQASAKLGYAYINLSPETKGAIIGDLEKLVQKYNPK